MATGVQPDITLSVGAEITVDMTKFNVNESTDPSMQIRLKIWGLLPIDLDRPGQLTAGVGAIWY